MQTKMSLCEQCYALSDCNVEANALLTNVWKLQLQVQQPSPHHPQLQQSKLEQLRSRQQRLAGLQVQTLSWYFLHFVVIFILPPFVIFKLRKTDQYPNEDSPQSTEMPVGPALEEEEEDGDQCKGGNRSQCILVFLVWWNHYPDMVCDNAVPFLGSPAWPEWLNQIWIFNWNETCVVFIVTKMWKGRWKVVTNIKY